MGASEKCLRVRNCRLISQGGEKESEIRGQDRIRDKDKWLKACAFVDPRRIRCVEEERAEFGLDWYEGRVGQWRREIHHLGRNVRLYPFERCKLKPRERMASSPVRGEVGPGRKLEALGYL